jgi:Zn-dependent M28 family amino/carboxypeptidase
VSELEVRDYFIVVQPFSNQGISLRNVIGKAEGEGSGETILLGAHFDTRPIADESRSSLPVPGANDGGSGVAVLLELGEIIHARELGCHLQLVFFDAEDSGGLEGWEWAMGSAHYVEQESQPPDAVVIVDMVGDRDLQLPRELNSDHGLQSELWDTGRELGYDAFSDDPGFGMTDDHTAFVRAGIPAVDIIDFEYPYWHTPEDTLDKVSASSLEAVGRTVHSWLLKRCRGY